MGNHETPRKIEFYWVNNSGWDKLDPEMAAWVKAYLEAFMNQADQFEFDFEPEQLAVQEQLAELERLDAQVQGEDLPDTLNMIMSAVQRVRDRG